MGGGAVGARMACGVLLDWLWMVVDDVCDGGVMVRVLGLVLGNAGLDNGENMRGHGW